MAHTRLTAAAVIIPLGGDEPETAFITHTVSPKIFDHMPAPHGFGQLRLIGLAMCYTPCTKRPFCFVVLIGLL